MADEEREMSRRQEESLKLYFEACKHMATLSTATAVLLVALYTQTANSPAWFTVTLTLIGLSVLSSLMGILVAIPTIGSGAADRTSPRLFLDGAVGFFVVALLLGAKDVLGLSWPVMAVTILAVMILLWTVGPLKTGSSYATVYALLKGVGDGAKGVLMDRFHLKRFRTLTMRVEDLERDLQERREPSQVTEEVPEGAEPRHATGGGQEATHRPWWRRIFDG